MAATLEWVEPRLWVSSLNDLEEYEIHAVDSITINRYSSVWTKCNSRVDDATVLVSCPKDIKMCSICFKEITKNLQDIIP